MVAGAPGRIRPLVGGRGRVRPLPGPPRPLATPPAKPAPLPHGAAVLRDGPLATAVLAALLPLVFQSFHYMIDAGPLYLLSKAWPVVMAPFAVLAVARGVAPLLRLYGVLLFYLTGVTPVLSMLHFGNGFLDAMATTVKVWPFLYLFAVLGILDQLRPSPDALRRAALGLGVATLAVMWLLWMVVPQHVYTSDPMQSKLFMYDIERGPRIYMPMAFALLLTFYAVRRGLSRFSLAPLLPAVMTAASLLLIYKQRTTIAAAAVVVGLIVLARLPSRLRWLAVGAGLFAGAAGIAVKLGGNGGLEALGASLAVRQATAMKVVEFLATDPLQWFFGVGAITRFSTRSLGDIFGSEMFYLADVGWLGVVFEYGAVGAVLILLAYLAGVRLALRRSTFAAGSPLSDFRMAVGDLALLSLIETAIYSPVFTPGIVASATALLVYLDRFASPQGVTAR